MDEKFLRRCAITVLCVLLMSLLAPAFARGIVSAHDHADTHVHVADDDHPGAGHAGHQHGHDLEEHDNLAHVLDHLSAKLTDVPSLIVPGVAKFIVPDLAASLLQTAPSALFRPPRHIRLA
jgi:ABC-type nickel/cobalt efflux system permease component RcnA